MDELVFVYGTLKSNFGNHAVLADSEFVSNHVTEPKYTMRSYGPFPAVTPKGITPITGELYRVTDVDVMRSLDYLEGYPDFYDRIEIPTPHGPAWMYVIHKDMEHLPVVQNGNWDSGGY